MPEEKPSPAILPEKLGAEFVIKFYRLFRGAAAYDRKNILIDRLNQECLQAIQGILQSQGSLVLKIVQDRFFFNQIQIQVKADKYGIFKVCWQEMRKRWIGGFEFTAKVVGEHLKEFVFLLAGMEESNENNYVKLQQQLEQRGIYSIRVQKLECFRDEEAFIDSENQKKYSKELYFRSILLIKEMMENIRQEKTPNVRKAKRLMQNAVNLIAQEDSILLSLANIKNYDEYTLNHSVNVAIYAMALGQRIGIPKKDLSHLGMAGLFHDIGKVKISPEILNKDGKLFPEEWLVLRSHPMIGAELILERFAWGELTARMLSGAFEHHLRYDLTGYPRLTRKIRLGLFGKIIAIADYYDALSRPRKENRFPYVSEKILGIMLRGMGKDFDPVLMKVFINMIGIYPLGTLVLLDTNEMGIVTQIQEDTDLIERPKVNLLYYDAGEYRKEQVVDLKEKDETTRDFKRSIIKVLDPNEYNMNVTEYLI